MGTVAIRACHKETLRFKEVTMNAPFRPMLNRLSPSITDMIRMDHSHVLATFHRYEPTSRLQTKKALVDTACIAG
jgi:hypothetical protein